MKNIESFGVTAIVTDELKYIGGGTFPPTWYNPVLAIFDAAMDGWELGTWLADQTCPVCNP